MEQLTELVELLLAAFEVNDLEVIIDNCVKAYTQTPVFIAENDLLWLPDHSPTAVLNFALPGELTHWMVYGDKIDEIHEKLAEQLDEDLPAFPYENNFTTTAYFKWLDTQLIKTGLELIETGNSFSDELQVLFVNRHDTTRIIELANQLQIHCKRTVQI